MADCLGFQRICKLRWRKIIVFDGITRTKHFTVLKSGNLLQGPVLHFFGQAAAKAVQVYFYRAPALRLHK